MRILHYFLGPTRQGGLNRYARDLAMAQQTAGHQVAILCPDGGLGFRKNAFIRSGDTFNGIPVYWLAGGKPVPLLEGIRSPKMILDDRHFLSDAECESFIAKVRPEAIHIHTWMGFPSELLLRLKQTGCHIVFTTHDFFGLCPRVNFIDEKGQSCVGCDNKRCSRCNANAPNERFLALRNWTFLLRLRKWLKPIAHRLQPRKATSLSAKEAIIEAQDYKTLQHYYIDLLKSCDAIHCNSFVAEDIYKRFLPFASYKVISITHSGIRWQPRQKPIDANSVRLGFIGPAAFFKGLPLLLDILQQTSHKNWHLDIWGTEEKHNEGSFSYRGNYTKPEEAFNELDLLVVPSIWSETFGFVVAEALSFGVPVLCSSTVGAQMLVDKTMVYHGADGLAAHLEQILGHPEILAAVRKQIVEGAPLVKTMEQHCVEMTKLYQ